MWKAEEKWDNKCVKQRKNGIINVESGGKVGKEMWKAEEKWDNKFGKQRKSGLINVERRGKVG